MWISSEIYVTLYYRFWMKPTSICINAYFITGKCIEGGSIYFHSSKRKIIFIQTQLLCKYLGHMSTEVLE